MADQKQPSAKAVKCVAVIQCEFAHERCTGADCARAFVNRRESFSAYGPEVLYYVPFPCGGCPGRRVGRLAHQLKSVMTKKAGLEPEEIAVHLSSCVVCDNAHYPPCPHAEDMKLMLRRKGMRVVEGTHFSDKAERRRAEGTYRPRPGQPG